MALAQINAMHFLFSRLMGASSGRNLKTACDV